jgi:hypothetical protein
MLLQDGKNVLVEGRGRLAGMQDVGQRNQNNPAWNVSEHMFLQY